MRFKKEAISRLPTGGDEPARNVAVRTGTISDQPMDPRTGVTTTRATFCHWGDPHSADTGQENRMGVNRVGTHVGARW